MFFYNVFYNVFFFRETKSKISLFDNKWHHYCISWISYAKKQMHLYIDGKLVAKSELDTQSISKTQPLSGMKKNLNNNSSYRSLSVRTHHTDFLHSTDNIYP